MKDTIAKGSSGRVQVRAVHSSTITKTQRSRFLDHLAATANVRRSAKAAGFLVHAAYTLRRRDPVFAGLWSEALAAGYERLEGELLVRALGDIDDNDITPGESGPVEAPFNQELALRMLTQRDKAAGMQGRSPARPPFKQLTREELEQSLLAKLDALEGRLKAAS